MSETKTDLIDQTVSEQSNELSVSAQQMMAQKEIEASIIVSQRFRRNEDAAYERVMVSCGRTRFAEMSTYSFPRGNETIEGPSVNLAREIARCWGNIRYGVDVIYDDIESRTIRAWAWDVESNTRRSQDATFKKLVYRRKGGWQKPDERDLRELTNRQGETAVRNCLLHLVPPDLVDDAMAACKKTLDAHAESDPDGARKNMIRAFIGIGVTVEQLEQYLGHSLKQANPSEVTQLRTIWKSISDGQSKWSEYVASEQNGKAPTGDVTAESLTGAKVVNPPPREQPTKPATPPTPPQDEPQTEKSTFDAQKVAAAFSGRQKLKEVTDLEMALCSEDPANEEQYRAIANERRTQIRATGKKDQSEGS